VKKDIEKNYYDTKFHGIDIEGNYKKTSELIDSAASSQEMTDLIARFCLLFDDSHLYFTPPRKTFRFSYGLNLQMIDDKAFVTGIENDSDAYKKGVRVGDQIYMIEGFIPNHQEFSVLMRHFYVLQPQPSMTILLIKPNGNKYKLNVEAKITEAGKFMPSRRESEIAGQNYESEIDPQLISDKIPGVSILKMKSFNLSEIKINKMMDKVEKSESLILDLRGNRGGYSNSLEQLIANFFDGEINVGTRVRRDGAKPFSVKQKLKKTYQGKLIVLIDSYSASAAEIFAYVVQLEKRGFVLGDQSEGSVMESIYFPHSFGFTNLFYGISVTVADIIMKDGQRLEKIGVTPDEKIFPSALDLANNRDPVLARAAQILNYKLTAEETGQFFKKDK
ncbi:MAG: S41 family peptidase, partial [Acidobacteriota bacterium]